MLEECGSAALTDRLKDESVSYLFSSFNFGYKITSLRSPVYTSISLSYHKLDTKVAAIDLPVLSLGMGYDGQISNKFSIHLGVEAIGNYFTRFEIKDVSRTQNDIYGLEEPLPQDFNLDFTDNFSLFLTGKYSILRNQNVRQALN